MPVNAAPAQTPQAAPREWMILTLLAGIQFTHIADFMIMMPLGPQFLTLFHLTAQQFGLLVSSYTFSAAIAGIAAAFFIDRFDRKQITLALYAGFALVTLLCGLVDGYASLLIVRSLAGAFGGVLTAMIFTLIAELIPDHRRGRAMGVVMSSFSISTIFGVPMGLYLAHHFGWRAPFIALAVLCGIFLLIGWRALPSMTAHLAKDNAAQRREPVWQPLANVWHYAPHRWAFLLALLMMIGGFSVIPYISLYLTANLGITQAQLPLFYLFGGAATLVTARVFGWCTDRFGKLNLFYVIAGSATVPILLLTHLTVTALPLVLAVTTLFFVFVSGRMIPGMALVTSTAHPQYRGTFMSLNASVQQMSMGIAAWLGGSIITQVPGQLMQHYERAGYVATAACMGSMWVASRLQRQATLSGPSVA